MIGIYPGSFDPVTNGHMDVILRAAKLVDTLIVAVLINGAKQPLFSVEERVDMLRCCTNGAPGIKVMSFDGLLMDFARQQHANFVVRGLRALSDFEAEFAMEGINKHLAPEIETIFLMTSTRWSYLSSSIIKEVARNGGNIDAFVPKCIAHRILEKTNP